jgi:DNA polymerase elongation subunit (family B)
VGIKYEMSAEEDAPISSMVMRRRDNAMVVRDVYGGVLDRILKERDVRSAAKFVTDSLMALVRGDAVG